MNLATTYLGLKLKNPLVASSTPMSEKVDTVKAMEDAGISAVVMHSLFEEQIRHEQNELEHYLERDVNNSAEALSYFPDLGHYKLGPHEYLEHIRKLKQAVDIPIIASLNGVSVGGWIDFAKQVEQAKADAIELNLYYVATNLEMTGAEIEKRYVDVLKAVKKAVKIPVAMKLSPFFSSVANMAFQLDKAGVNGLVLFNRFYQPDIDIEKREVVPNVVLSNSSSLRLPLRWLAILSGRIRANLAASTGVHTHQDVIKLLMAGADVTMMASALLKHGVWHAASIAEALAHWLEEHEFQSVAELRGSLSQKKVAEPAAFERANYMKVLASLG